MHAVKILHGAEKMSLKAKKVLESGGAGFIGSDLREELLARGYELPEPDNFATSSRTNIVHLIKDKNSRFRSL